MLMYLRVREVNWTQRQGCVMLGYGEEQKGYRLYDLCWRKVFFNRDVIFYEASMPGIQKEQKENDKKSAEFQIQESVEECANSEVEVIDFEPISNSETREESVQEIDQMADE